MAVNARTGERLVRLAYDLESLSARLGREGYESEAGAVRSAMKDVRWAGDAILRKRGA